MRSEHVSGFSVLSSLCFLSCKYFSGCPFHVLKKIKFVFLNWFICLPLQVLLSLSEQVMNLLDVLKERSKGQTRAAY